MEEIEKVIKCMTPCEICPNRYECQKKYDKENDINNKKLLIGELCQKWRGSTFF